MLIVAVASCLLVTLAGYAWKSKGTYSLANVHSGEEASSKDIEQRIKREVAAQLNQRADGGSGERLEGNYFSNESNRQIPIPSSEFVINGEKDVESIYKNIERSLIAKLSVPELIKVPAGSFMMGGSSKDPFAKPREFPNRKVTFYESFWIGKYEITVGQFRAFVIKTNYKTLAERSEAGGWKSGRSTSWGEQNKDFIWKNPGYAYSEQHPVTLIAYEDAVAYCDWLSSETGKKYRLPTEVEWEYACKAATESVFCFDRNNRDEYSWSGYNSGATSAPHPVGLRRPNPWGVHDMVGNIREWCLDWFAEDSYKTPFEEQPRGPGTGEFRVIRGASFLDRELFMRSSHRGYLAPDLALNNQGFRVMCENAK
jgi:formylglycine-generating enzyme required for sulfatase activity